MTHPSIADQAVEVIAAIRNLDTEVSLKHPERHAVRDMKRTAEAILANALQQAKALIDSAERLRHAMREHEASQCADMQKGKA